MVAMVLIVSRINFFHDFYEHQGHLLFPNVPILLLLFHRQSEPFGMVLYLYVYKFKSISAWFDVLSGKTHEYEWGNILIGVSLVIFF